MESKDKTLGQAAQDRIRDFREEVSRWPDSKLRELHNAGLLGNIAQAFGLTGRGSYEELRKKIRKIAPYVEPKNQDITLYVYGTGDRSVGINPCSYKITIEGGRPAIEDDKDYRNGVRDIFIEAVKNCEDDMVSSAWFDDECPDCNKLLPCKCREYEEEQMREEQDVYDLLKPW